MRCYRFSGQSVGPQRQLVRLSAPGSPGRVVKPRMSEGVSTPPWPGLVGMCAPESHGLLPQAPWRPVPRWGLGSAGRRLAEDAPQPWQPVERGCRAFLRALARSLGSTMVPAQRRDRWSYHSCCCFSANIVLLAPVHYGATVMKSVLSFWKRSHLFRNSTLTSETESIMPSFSFFFFICKMRVTVTLFPSHLRSMLWEFCTASKAFWAPWERHY